jgi:hypothetical protein
MGWIVTTLFCELGGPYWFVSLFGVIFLLPVQSHVNRINAAVCPRHDPNSRLTLVNGVAIGIGLVLLVVTAVGIGAT